MALRMEIPPRNPAIRVTTGDPDRTVAFVTNGQEHRVDLRAPRSVRRGRRRMVQLIDLWVASLLPGDFLDLRFELVTSEGAGTKRHSAPLDALLFARGFVTRPGRILFWEEAGDAALNGQCLEAIVVHRAATDPVPRILAPVAPPPRSARVLDLTRLLPHALSYPEVRWRSASG